jgi:hypothetical protein
MRSSSELDAVASARKAPDCSDSFKTEEKTGSPATSDERGLGPATSTAATTNPPVHQLGVQAPGDLMVADGVEWTP